MNDVSFDVPAGRTVALVGVGVLVLLAVTWFGWQPIVERFDQIFTGSGEFAVDRLLVSPLVRARQTAAPVVNDARNDLRRHGCAATDVLAEDQFKFIRQGHDFDGAAS